MSDYQLTKEKTKEAKAYLAKFAQSRAASEEDTEKTLMFKNYIEWLRNRK